jgi:hypothetical protein
MEGVPAVPSLGGTMRRIYDTLDVEKTPRFPTQTALHQPYDELLKKKKVMLSKQKVSAKAIRELLVNQDVSWTAYGYIDIFL